MQTLFFSLLLSTGVAIAAGNQARAADLNVEPRARAAAPAQVYDDGPIYEERSEVILVRDGCGPGRRFSRYRGICVWDGPARVYGPPVYAPPPAYGYYGYGPAYYGPPVVYGPPVYGYGYRRYYW